MALYRPKCARCRSKVLTGDQTSNSTPEPQNLASIFDSHWSQKKRKESGDSSDALLIGPRRISKSIDHFSWKIYTNIHPSFEERTRTSGCPAQIQKPPVRPWREEKGSNFYSTLNFPISCVLLPLHYYCLFRQETQSQFLQEKCDERPIDPSVLTGCHRVCLGISEKAENLHSKMRPPGIKARLQKGEYTQSVEARRQPHQPQPIKNPAVKS